MSEHRVCQECNPPHVDNCHNCFGYGFKPNGGLIAAGEAGDKYSGDYTPCPVCGGTPHNEDLKERMERMVCNDGLQ